jgi:energy-coupling factor transport system ATP-binding protein
MIRFENVSFKYESELTISDVSFHIKKGEFVAVIGSNGAGKTTVSKLINGIYKPCLGNVIVNGKNTKTARTSELAKSIGFLFQNPDRQICRNTIREEILFGLKNVLSDHVKIMKRCDETLSNFGFVGSKDPFSLSRGERQRIALASVLAIKPEILVLDEPTTGLDYRECMQIMEIIKELNGQGATVVMISHDMEIVQDFAQRVLVMGSGKLMADGEKSKVFLDTELMKAASVRPPQLIELSGRLGKDFKTVQSAADILNTIKRLKGAVS